MGIYPINQWTTDTLGYEGYGDRRYGDMEKGGRRVVCGVRYVVCGMWYAVCGVCERERESICRGFGGVL